MRKIILLLACLALLGCRESNSAREISRILLEQKDRLLNIKILSQDAETSEVFERYKKLKIDLLLDFFSSGKEYDLYVKNNKAIHELSLCKRTDSARSNIDMLNRQIVVFLLKDNDNLTIGLSDARIFYEP
ncbi:MAG: hypothetical protein JXD23_16695 [Spirochaetales bacterium]|nr:hypothetical protein [Spirochaetales bacterium]